VISGEHLNISFENVYMGLFGGNMNKDILVIIGLIIATLGFIISVVGSLNIRDAVSNAVVIQNFILYSLCLIIAGTRRET
jgi:hypothetical protein